MPAAAGTPRRRATAFAASAALLAACAAPAPPPAPPERPTAGVPAVPGIGPSAAFAREVEEQRRGIGVPPPLPPAGTVDRLSGELRASRPAPGLGPSAPAASLPVPGNSQSRLSALPASPLANPRGGFMPGRP